jgi:hypothetical protein
MCEVNEPCANEDCDKCYPLPRFKISTERVQRIRYERKIKAKDEAEAIRIYNEGTQWPSSYDDRYGEILEQHEPVVTVVPPLDEPMRSRILEEHCYHNLPRTLPSLTSCDFVGDLGCSDPDCAQCFPKRSHDG